MKTVHVLKLLLVCISLTFSNFIYSQTKVETKSSNGLNTATFYTKKGKVNVYFPDIQEGDVISGTVLTEPAGKNERQKTKNSNIISGYVVEVENDDNEKDKTNVKNKIFQWIIPASVTEGLKLVLKDPKGKVIGTSEIPVNTEAPYMEMPSVVSSESFGIPEYIQAGSPGSIPGVFDGDFSSTDLNIGGNDIDILAESPRGIFFENPEDISGPTDIKLNEGTVEANGVATAYDLSLTADKLTLQKGDKTTVHIQIDGLAGLDEEIPVDIRNLTDNTVTVEGGNQQSIIIDPEDVSPDGTFTADIPVTAIRSGNFSVAVNVKPPQPIVINRIYPIDDISSPMPTFVWSAINAPPDCNYSISIWDVRTFENASEREDFTFSPEMVEGLEPLIEESGLEETSFFLSDVEEIQLQPDHVYAWQISAVPEGQAAITPGMWHFTVDGQAVKDDYDHVRNGKYASKYYPEDWVHISRGDYASKIYNPATHRHLTSKEYNTKIYSPENYRHITRDDDKTKIYPRNMRHISTGDNESYLYNPQDYQPHRTSGSRASLLIPNGYEHLLNQADRSKIYPESDRHLRTGDNNTKIVPDGHVHITRDPFNSKIYPRGARHISWGTTNVSKIIPEGMKHIDRGDDLSKLHNPSDRHLKGGRDNSKIVPEGNEHVSSGDDQSKIYPEDNNHIRRGTNASGIYDPDSDRHLDMGDNQTQIVPEDYHHISSGDAQSKYGPSRARHIDEGDNSTKLHTRDGRNIEPASPENPPDNASEPGRPQESETPDEEAGKPDEKAKPPTQQPEEPGEPQEEPKELDEW